MSTAYNGKRGKISLIIPVYKVEPYLRKCLDSVTGQTYRELEIICVDDGSPDGSGRICDEYAERDSRVRVIHKENGGVSSARNAGLRAATGEWIGWVDSDDWAEPDMFEYLLRNAEEEGADIAVCGRTEVYGEERNAARGWDRREVLDSRGALEQLLKDDAMMNYLWDKLCRRELYEGLEFPEGRTYEDISLVYKLFERAEKIVCLPGSKYNYRQRAGSIVQNVTLENQVNYFKAARERYEDMRERWPEFRTPLEKQCAASVVAIWCTYYDKSRRERKEGLGELREIAAYTRENYGTLMEAVGLGQAGRVVMPMTVHVSWWAFAVAWTVNRLYKLKHRKSI